MPDNWRLLTGDCLDVLATLEPESVDACATDPPYGIGFMGREWDVFKSSEVAKRSKPRNFTDPFLSKNPNLQGRSGWQGHAPVEYDRSAAASLKFQAWTQQWAEAVWRVLKPGAHAVVCASPRMGHRVTCGLEDAGFEIRNLLLWLYGSGFPKSLDVGKQLDRTSGAEREIIGTRKKIDSFPFVPGQGETFNTKSLNITVPATDRAHQWDGWGTALKPAYEPIILARKPLGGRTVAQCVAAFGTGALNIDGCRLSTDGRPLRVGDYKDTGNNTYTGRMNGSLQGGSRAAGQTDLGRWPPNVALDETAAARLDAEGGTSRFFYVAKASRSERERGCEDLPQRTAGEATDRQDGSAGLESPRAGASRTHGARNHHPTVKPVALMRWLVRLVTPPGGLVLDPFAGSGTTGLACIKEQCRFLGIEREAAYVAIANARLQDEHARFETGGPLFAGAVPDTADTCLR